MKSLLNSPLLCILCSFFLIASCSVSKSARLYSYKDHSPPGTIKLADNFYCDQNEISVIDWREYMYWTGRIYGKSSDQFKDCLPDTTVWLREDTCFKSFISEYLRHPKYNYQPIVGINLEQANAYSVWRADRIFEQILIEKKLICIDTSATPQTHFTVERYYKDKLNTYLSDERLRYYPACSLPSKEDRALILHIVDSTNLANLKSCASKKCANCHEAYPFVYKIESPCTFLSDVSGSHSNAHGIPCVKKLAQVYKLRGGVQELSNQENISFGGSWNNSRERILSSDNFHNTQVNAVTGFRNVCSWVEWSSPD